MEGKEIKHKDACFRCSKNIQSKDLIVANDGDKYMRFHYWCYHKTVKEMNDYNRGPVSKPYPDA